MQKFKHNMRFILIVVVIVGSLLSLSFYSVAKPITNHAVSIDIKQALMAASARPALSSNISAVPLLSNNDNVTLITAAAMTPTSKNDMTLIMAPAIPSLSANTNIALIAASAMSSLSINNNIASAIPPFPKNHLTTENTLYSPLLARNEPLPDALPTPLSDMSHPVNTEKTIISEFPSELPDSIENAEYQPENINTPEYVIIRSSDRVTFSSEMTAEVALLTVKEGSDFKVNDILLQFDCRERAAELKKAEAQQRSMNEAKKSAEKLQSYGSISEYELIKAQSEASMANADVDKLKAIVDKCTIKAPFNGAVSELMVHAHETVKPGDPLLRIVNTDNLELQMQVPSAWLQWIKIGTAFDVHVSELGKPIAAKIIKINPQIDSVSQTVKIVGIIIERDPELRPGMSGQAIFPDNPDTKTSQSKP